MILYFVTVYVIIIGKFKEAFVVLIAVPKYLRIVNEIVVFNIMHIGHKSGHRLVILAARVLHPTTWFH